MNMSNLGVVQAKEYRQQGELSEHLYLPYVEVGGGGGGGFINLRTLRLARILSTFIVIDRKA